MDEFDGAMATAEAPEGAAEEKTEVAYDVDLDYNMEWEVETEPAEPDVIITEEAEKETEEEAEEEPYYEPYAPRAARAINKHLFVWVFNFMCGLYGVDRFVRGQIAAGVIKLLTFGGLGCWYLADLIIAIVKAYGADNESEDLYFDVFGRYID